MGLVYTEIELVNTEDEGVFNRGYIKVYEIRKVTTTALVDSGALMLCINEAINQQLGLKKTRDVSVELADGTLKKYPVHGPVTLKFRTRTIICEAILLERDNEVLLGSIPLEDLDVIIDPLKETLALPPDRPYLSKKKLK
ncbi:MAG: retroviral-like aspartic protease family protein [Bacteroidia bacterium]|nr:retroviral-like aspartic protease family protein [Bacteroidia bacterium]